MKLVNIGFGNMVNADRLIATVGIESAPTKRLITAARQRGMLIDTTYGRKARSVLVMDSEHVVLCALSLEVLAGRMQEESIQGVDENE